MVYNFGDFVSTCEKNFIEICGFKKKPFRSKFVFKDIWNDMDSFKGDIQSMKKYFKKFRTDVILNEPVQHYDNIPVGGYYTPDTNRIELVITVNDFNNYSFSDKDWFQFKFIVIQVMAHELVHMMQFVNRDFFWSYKNCKYRKVRSEEKNANRKYHANMDEIQAYAHCIYLELTQFGFQIPKSKEPNDVFKLSVTFNMILNVFGNRMNQPAITKTIFHIRQWDKKYNAIA